MFDFLVGMLAAATLGMVFLCAGICIGKDLERQHITCRPVKGHRFVCQ